MVLFSTFLTLLSLASAALAFPTPTAADLTDSTLPTTNRTLALHAQYLSRPIHHGHCGIHIKQTWGNPHGNRTLPSDYRAGTFTAYILDAQHYVLGTLPPTRFTYDNKPGLDESTVIMPSKLDEDMYLTFEGEGAINEFHRKMYVDFQIGGDNWRSDDDGRCRVGGVETIWIMRWFLFANMRRPIAWTREMDCGFAC